MKGKDASADSGVMSYRKKLIFALAIVLAIFLAPELILRAIFPADFSYFSESPSAKTGIEQIVFLGNKHRPEFQAPKPEVFRIMVFGESAVDGFPGFPSWMEEMINDTGPPKPVEVINLAVSGVTSTEMRAWYYRSLDWDPDLIILYVGNNDAISSSWLNPVDHPLGFAIADFIGRTKTATLIRKAIKTTNAALIAQGTLNIDVGKYRGRFFPLAKRKKIDRLYAGNMASMIEAARSRRIPVVLIYPAGNVKGFRPFKSAHYRTLDPKLEQEFTELANRAGQALAAGNLDPAALQFEQALKIDPTYAQARFDYARTLETRGELENARQNYLLAWEWDDFPLRAPRSFIAQGQRLEKEDGVIFLDMNERLASHRPDRIAGFETFNDHVHFRSAGEYEISLVLIDALYRRRMLSLGQTPIPAFDLIAAKVAPSPKEREYLLLQEAIAQGFTLDNPDFARESIRSFEALEQLHAIDPFPRLTEALLYLKLGETENARLALANAYALDPHYTEILAPRLFPGVMEIYQGQVAVAISPETNWLKLAIQIETFKQNPTAGPNAAPPFGNIPLERMAYVFEWSAKDLTFLERTPMLEPLQQEKAALREKSPHPSRLNLLQSGGHLLSWSGFDVDPKTKSFVATGPDSYLVISPFPVDPLALPLLHLTATISIPDRPENWIAIYWRGQDQISFDEDHKLFFPWPGDGKERTLDVPLGQIFALLADRPITSLRLDFTAQPATIQIKELSLQQDDP